MLVQIIYQNVLFSARLCLQSYHVTANSGGSYKASIATVLSELKLTMLASTFSSENSAAESAYQTSLKFMLWQIKIAKFR